ncbi:LysR family transcriptional regulator [Cellulomonas triticagri]|uniref:LysR family transcriptional regulator n=1 Tax=Cellulomonas triticagri TaxID=2483352 RepID=A0A3M2J474_9CELL|nr:LysR family transcriptional regulator [Cellulomonas triticagri]RMI08912.1 LysR family transcriptional regulator [Cellulomonas triticagri]
MDSTPARRLDAAALRLVRAVHDTGSVTAAARALGLTQPAASQQLRVVERMVGTPVVVRAGRGVRLTEAGQVLARNAAAVQAALDATLEEVAAVASLRAGRVRVAAFPSAAATLLPGALAALRAAHPGLTSTFAEAEPPEALTELDAGRVDVAVTFRDAAPGPGADPSPAGDAPRRLRVPLLRDDVVVVLPASDGLPDGSPVDLATLADRPWIAGCPQCRAQLVATCARAGFAPGVDYATDDYLAVLGLVRAGLGVATLPGLALAALPRAGVTLHPGVPGARRLVEAVVDPGTARVPAVAAALDALRTAAASIRHAHVLPG